MGIRRKNGHSTFFNFDKGFICSKFQFILSSTPGKKKKISWNPLRIWQMAQYKGAAKIYFKAPVLQFIMRHRKKLWNKRLLRNAN